MKQPASGPDPVIAGDRNAGSTPPEGEQEGDNVVGRPQSKVDAEPFNEQEALSEGGSFDSIARLQDVDA